MRILQTLVIGIMVMATLPTVQAEEAIIPEPARPADSLVESIGVATHWGFHNTIYHQKYESLQSLLGGLGVRYVRDSYDPHLDDLWQRYGVRAILVTDPSVSLEKYLSQWRAKRQLIAAIEGSNEVNGSWAKLRLSYQGKGFPDGPRLFHDDVFKSIRSDPELKDLPVIAPSTAYKGDGALLAPLRSFDFANTHSYAGGDMPSQSLDFKDPYLLLGRGAVCPPLVATESGYHTCLGSSRVIAGSQQGISHEAHRKYIPRHVAEYFNAGFRWTVIYEFAAGRPKKGEQEDPEAAFGLLMPDGAPKPAYHALKRLIELISESHWDAAKGVWVRSQPASPRALAFALQGAPESLHHVLLQRSDGSFQLLLWNEVTSFDLKNRKDVSSVPAKLKLKLGDLAEWVTVSSLDPHAPATRRVESIRELDLEVPDEVVVLGIKLAEDRGTLPLATPSGLDAQAGPTSVSLSWPAAAGVEAYWVSLNGRNLGMAAKGVDGRATFSMKGLIPATAYPFQIVAASLEGSVSAPAKLSVTTVDAFPDLVVRSLKASPASPREGDSLTFSAVVENRGKAATEEDVVVGVKFAVDGKTVSWCDRLRGPLAPGQQVEVSPSGGPAGVTTYAMPRGCHSVTAFVDDVNRIIESNETNNRARLTVSTGTGPDLAVKEVLVQSAQGGKPLVVDVTVSNEGSEPTPTGLTLSASVIDADAKPAKLLGYVLSRQSVAAGQSCILRVTCSEGLPAGKHTIRVVLDDVHRIPQLDKVSHQSDVEITVGE